MKPARTLICTVGTSLITSHLQKLAPGETDPTRRALFEAYAARDWDAVALALDLVEPTDPICGAEINSLASLLSEKYRYAEPGAGLHFCHSATEEGRAMGQVLERYYDLKGHPVVELREIEDLQDGDPRRFRTRGLRNLAKSVCKVIRDHGAGTCAINATGGYKAQIAIAVLMGQALGVPVYYKHERFDEIIAFPPMPVALNFEVWMRHSGVLFALERQGTESAAILDEVDDDAEVLESLVERTAIDGVDYLELSPTGQIFHETFRARFRNVEPELLPPAVPLAQKKRPSVHDSGHVPAEVLPFLEAVTAQVPQVSRCATFHLNPDLPEPTRFRLGSHGIEGILSNGTATVKFRVETRAQTDAQRLAMVAALNEWLNTTR